MSKGKILLVDDEPDIRAVGTISLANVGGWEVVVAASGAAALEQLAAGRPDVVLLDVMMPGMDGPTTLRQLRALEGCADLPVIFLTAKVQARETERYLALGALGVIAKPFDPMSLSDEVRQILAGAPSR